MGSFRRLAPVVLFATNFLISPLLAQQSTPVPRPLTIMDLFAFRDLHDPQISPDGKWVAYTVGALNRDEDKNEERIWMVPTAGGEAIALSAERVSSLHPRWSPDGKYLAFLFARNEGKTQVWLLNRLGGEAQKLTETP